MPVIVPTGAMEVSRRRGDTLSTHGVGASVAVALYDAEAGVAALLHAALPASTVDPVQARLAPAMFVDTGVPAVLAAMAELGAQPERTLVRVVGAASLLDAPDALQIGARNMAVLRRVLADAGLEIAAEQVGGTRPRAVSLSVADGRTVVRTGEEVTEL